MVHNKEFNNALCKELVLWFKDIQQLDKRLEVAREELVKLRVLSTHVASNVEVKEVQSSGVSHDKIGDTVSNIVDLEKECIESINELVGRKRKARTRIDSLTDERHKLILELRYFSYLGWEDTAEEVDYSVKQAKRLHDEAIVKITENISNGIVE